MGHSLALKCLRNNFQVISLSRNKPKKERFLKKVKYLYADISSKKQLKYKLNLKFNYVVNFGGDVDHHGKNTLKSHFHGCKNLVDILKKKRLKNLYRLEAALNMLNKNHLIQNKIKKLELVS